jgi:hypothetical protein
MTVLGWGEPADKVKLPFSLEEVASAVGQRNLLQKFQEGNSLDIKRVWIQLRGNERYAQVIQDKNWAKLPDAKQTEHLWKLCVELIR